MSKEIFKKEDYSFICELIESKLPKLKENSDFKLKYERLSDVIEELEKSLEGRQKDLFNEIIELFYKTEEYYFILAYSLGLKYGKELDKI